MSQELKPLLTHAEIDELEGRQQESGLSRLEWERLFAQARQAVPRATECPACNQGVKGPYSASTGVSHSCGTRATGEGEVPTCPFCGRPPQIENFCDPPYAPGWAECETKGCALKGVSIELSAWATRTPEAK